MLAREPRGMTTSPSASRASRVTWASKVWPSAAVAESMASLVRTETSLPAGNTNVLVVTGGGGAGAGRGAGSRETSSLGAVFGAGAVSRGGAVGSGFTGAAFAYSTDWTLSNGIL